MAPLPQEYVGAPTPGTPLPSDDDIVISGISGLLPGCASYNEFVEKIYQKKNLISTNTRWHNIRHPELPAQCGTVPDLDVFDAQFFTVFYTLAQSTEPTARKMFEQTYQAIFDSGICPMELSGKKVGVYVSAAQSETEKISCDPDVPLGLIGCSRSMSANRISYWLNLKGPSITLDGSCCGTLLALEKARDAIRSGICEAAIVGSGKLVLHPQTSINTNRALHLNFDGKTKCYDEAADGQSMAEAINVIFLQKYKDAKRVYSVLRHVKAVYAVYPNEASSEDFQIPRDVEILTNFFREFYNEAGVSPSAVEYVEGFGAASQKLDKLELQAMEKTFCEDRSRPLLVGSVTSNVGYTETAVGSCALFKLLSAYQRGEIAATINCENPRRDIPALQDGRMSIVTENKPFDRTFSAVNGFSVTGINAHVLLQGCYKPKNLSRYHSDIPYLVAVSGRQETSVEKILNDIKDRQLDPEELALIHNIHKSRISKHLARGFGIYSTQDNETLTHCMKVDYYDDAKRPLWFVYSGMGSQWVGMGAELMRIPIFAQAIQRCHKVLEPKGIDLIHIITTKDKTIFKNILHAFVGISAIQIGLTDVLTAIGLVPDKIIGHSLGELGCAYVDNCLTYEEMILLAYIRGIVSIETPIIHGSMAAIGMGFKSISKICPSDIEVACHNSSDSCTISGPAEAVHAFVERLTEQGVFAKEVQCSNIPYHSRYIANAGPDFFRMSKEVVKEPKRRTERWVSSSVPQDRWHETNAVYSNAEYHTNNLLNTVLFEEALRHVPSNAVLVEIAPHGLLQAILKRALPRDCRHIPLTHRAQPDNALFLLEAIGKLYMEGYDPDISALYPKIEFPVSSETRSLSHMIEWAHTEKWKVCSYVNADRTYCSVLRLLVTVQDDGSQYLNGHYIEGVRVFPFAAMLVAVWDTVAMTAKQRRREVSVQFSDVKFHSQPPIYDQQLLYLTVNVQKGSGRFEVFHDNGVLIEGYVIIVAGKKFASNEVEPTLEEDNDTNVMQQDDIYKVLYERGYGYKDQFRSIKSVNSTITEAEIFWQDNWITFLDGVFQTCTLRDNHTGISLPSYMKKMIIDIKVQLNERVNSEIGGVLKASYNKIHKKTRCGGVTLEDVFYKCKPISNKQSILLETQKFIPFYQKDFNDVTTAIYVSMQIVAENVNSNKLNVLYITAQNRSNHINKMKQLIPNTSELNMDVVFAKKDDLLEGKYSVENPDVIFMQDLLSDKKVFESLYKFIAPDTFLINIGIDTTSIYPTSLYKLTAAFGSERTRVELVKFRPSPISSNITAVSVRNNADIHHLKNTCNNLPPQHKLLVLAPYPTPSDVKTMVQCWRKDGNRNVSLVMFDEKHSMDKELENIPDEPCSVLCDGAWGNEYYVPTKFEAISPIKCVSLRCAQPGNINTMNWIEVEDPTGPGINVTVHYAGLSVKDAKKVLAATPTFSANEEFGMDFSGITDKGERVMGLVASGAASSMVRARPELLWPVPPHWSLEDAATVPLAYAHAFYCLAIKVPLKKGMTILIHGGAGALGQAAISIALANGCKVFTTVSDLRKKRFLKKLFPELRDDHIGNSRDNSFADMIRNALRKDSETAGCDIVISCVKGDLKNASMSCCGLSGYTLDITQLEDQEHFPFGLSHLTMARSYNMTDLSSIFKENNIMDMRKLQLLVSEGIVRGYVRPLSRVTYEPHETPRALRLLAASRHRGRVLVSMQQKITVTPRRISCTPGRSYLVVCDDEGLGLQFADTLVARGANKLHLHCQPSPYLKHKVIQWQKQGVKVETSSESLSSKDDVIRLLKHTTKMGVIDGIYVMAVDEDHISETASMVAMLDSTARKYCPNLSHFAVISEDDKPWKDTVVKRAHEKLPALSLQLQKVHRPNQDHDDKTLLRQNAIKAIEQALASNDTIVRVSASVLAVSKILEELSKIPGVNITNATVDRTRLEQVGVDEGRARELCNVLQEKFNIDIPQEKVPRMTIAQLKKLDEDIVNIEDDPSGFGAYFSIFDPDEMQGSNDMVLMPTLVQSSNLRADEFDVDRDFLCIIPGLEDHYKRWYGLSERLRLPAATLAHQASHHSLQDMAEAKAQIIMQKLSPKKSFYLLGYDFGVLVALEVASILESYGLTGTVFMLGGTPAAIFNSFNDRWKSHTVEEMQNALILYMYNLISRTTNTDLEDQLKITKGWNEKVDLYIKFLRKKVSHTMQYVRELIDRAYARVKLLQNYTPKQYHLRSNLILLRAKLPVPAADPLKYFPNDIQVHNLKASLAYAYKDLTCSNIINKYLDKDILDDYDNSNQCETVLVNNETFLKFKIID